MQRNFIFHYIDSSGGGRGSRQWKFPFIFIPFFFDGFPKKVPSAIFLFPDDKFDIDLNKLNTTNRDVYSPTLVREGSI